MKVNLVWITPDAERLLVQMARVSNPSAAQGTSKHEPERLIGYLIRHNHWSPFEMVSACVEIETTRDIGRQILRHRSFSFQEFSQRYAAADALPEAPFREARLQDTKNRQNSIEIDGEDTLRVDWAGKQSGVRRAAYAAYHWALDNGIAKEVARAVLPEGLTGSRMYMSGTFRSWLHFLAVRNTPETQKEHREIAQAIQALLQTRAPSIFAREGSTS